mmetsp:Transcript_17157/g.35231  ORF Transcript_17157/g.35231 Transcript_17157/m.35231 type:complete len:255 (-) Transcript_17157:446-1210(-)
MLASYAFRRYTIISIDGDLVQQESQWTRLTVGQHLRRFIFLPSSIFVLVCKTIHKPFIHVVVLGILWSIFLLEEPHPVVDLFVEHLLETTAMDEPVHEWSDGIVADTLDGKAVDLVSLSDGDGPVDVGHRETALAAQLILFLVEPPVERAGKLVDEPRLSANDGDAGVALQLRDLLDGDGGARSRRAGRQRVGRLQDQVGQGLIGPFRNVLFFPGPPGVPDRRPLLAGVGGSGGIHGGAGVFDLFGGNISDEGP